MEKWLQGKVNKWFVKRYHTTMVVWYELDRVKLYRVCGTEQQIMDKIANHLYKHYGLGYYQVGCSVNEINLDNGRIVVAHVTCLSSLERTQELVELLQDASP